MHPSELHGTAAFPSSALGFAARLVDGRLFDANETRVSRRNVRAAFPFAVAAEEVVARAQGEHRDCGVGVRAAAREDDGIVSYDRLELVAARCRAESTPGLLPARRHITVESRASRPGVVAQLGERRVRNAKVGSSILLHSTIT